MYFTFFKQEAPAQITLEDWLLGRTTPKPLPYLTSFTCKVEYDYAYRYSVAHPLDKNIPLPPDNLDMSYETFYIPKKSGGLREINAPNPQLMNYLTDFKDYLQTTLRCRTHNAAHAYVAGRSNLSCINIHKMNKSQWFLSLDFKSFFPSHTPDYCLNMLRQCYPFTVLFRDAEYYAKFKSCLELGFLNGKLPMGTPLSPLLTNLCFTPLDYEIEKALHQYREDMCYTRYADDIIISAKQPFSKDKVINIIESLIGGGPLHLNPAKTSYSSIYGKNWHLGLMLNKDLNVTIGHAKAKQFKAMLNNFALNADRWEYEDRDKLKGLISYYRMIEPDYIDFCIARINAKYNTNIEEVLKK